MPIYDSDEHELLSEKSKMTRGGDQYDKGTLFLTDKRIIYEEKGHRGLLRAASSKILLDIQLYNLINVSTAIPKIKLWTKKMLSVEFETQNGTDRATFTIKDPKKWHDEMMKWTTDAKRRHDQDEKLRQEEERRRELELAKAKAPTANIGMYINAKKEQKRDENSFIDTTYHDLEGQTGQIQPVEKLKKCKNCGKEIPDDAIYCPYCGAKQ
ncbi:MAG: zinc ribbon domain-containing protein [Thermoplasmata archaeon]